MNILNDYDLQQIALKEANSRVLPEGLTLRERAHLRVQWRHDAMKANPLRTLIVVNGGIAYA